ncbi:MAG: efflux RND transporter periplasmic adaptor subunit [Gemmataceae bacterium]
MMSYLRTRASERPYAVARFGALVVLLSIAAAWLWAHEGHEPLPTRGAKTIKNKANQVVGVILSKEARDSLGLETAKAEERALERRVLAYASLATPWQGHAFATSRLQGRIEKLHVQAGESVAAGQVLADVRSVELENLQLELLTARTESRLSAKLAATAAESHQRGSISEQSLLDATAKHQQNLNAVEVAKSKWFSLGLAQQDLDRLFRVGKPVVSTLPVKSPIAGTVTHADLSVGKVVEPAEHLFEVIDLAKVWVKIGVLERDLHRVTEGQAVELSFPAYPGEVFRARVEVKGLHLDGQTHLNTVWAELSNPPGKEPRFYPGLNGQAELVLQGGKKSVVVPPEALVHNGAESYVLVEGADTPDGSEYLKVPVVVGRRAGDAVEILGGDVFPGSYVVTRGSHELAGYFVPGVLRPGTEARRDMGLEVGKASVQSVDRVLQVEGAVDVPPDRRAVLSAQVAGTIQEILVDRGQEVKAGQEVARVASLELQSLQLELLKAHLETQLVEETFRRMKTARGSLPPRLLLETESRLNTLRHQRDAAGRKLTSIGLSAEQLEAVLTEKKLVHHLPVRATIAGRVVKFDKAMGQSLKAEEGIFEVHDLTRPFVQAFVAEDDLPQVRVGQKARVRLTADPSFVGEATVVRSGRVFGGDSRTMSVWVRLENPPAQPLLHNQLARLNLLVGPASSGVAVPLTALAREGTRSFVFVQKPDGSFERRAVETGPADDRLVLIAGGLAEGESVAIAGTQALQTAYSSIR